MKLLWLLGIVAYPVLATEVSIQFWHSMSGEKGKIVSEMVEEFNKANAGKIKAQAQFVGTYEEGLNKTRTALLAKRGPHVVQITDIGTMVMIDTGAIAPLQDFVDNDPSFPSKELLPQLRRYYEYGGKLQSLPFATSNPILYYNEDAFKKVGLTRAPKTFQELVDYSRKLTTAETKTKGITWPLHSWFFEQFVARQGQVLVNFENGRSGRATEANFLSAESLNFVSLWAAMVKEGIFSNVGRGWEPAEQNFLAGRAAMLITSTSDVFEVQKKVSFKVVTAPIPAKDESTKGGTIIGGNSLWILKDKPDAEKQAAYELVKWMASKPMQKKWHTNTGYFPIRADLISELEKEGFYKKYPNAKTAIDQLRASPSIPATSGALLGVFPELRENIDSAIERVLTSGEDPKTALGKAKEQTEKALARYNRGREKS